MVALAALLSACVPVPPPEPLPPAPVEPGLRVMTYNVLGAMGDDALFSEHAGWAARVDQLQPDVLVLQEAQSDDVNAILALTSGAYALGVFVEWDCDLKPVREGVAILVRTSLVVVGAGGVNVGSSCFEPTIKRPLAWVDLELLGGAFRVYGTHLTQPGRAYDGSRATQIRRIKERIVRDDPDDQRRWVLAGDMNFVPSDASYRLMMGDLEDEPGPYPLVDTYLEVSAVAGDPLVCPTVAAADASAMAALWADPAHVRSCGYTAGWPKDDNIVACGLLPWCVSWEQRRVLSVRERLDYVVRPLDGPVRIVAAFLPSRLDDDWAHPGAEWYRLSDHLPYVVDLEIDGP